MKFYFTYGTSETFPYKGGWTTVEAPNRKLAIELFRYYHPDKNKGIINCSSIYDEKEFAETTMIEENLGSKEHEYLHMITMRNIKL